MSYKSLLFCPDERAARLVTQVLSELDFTVELASETFATVKKLGAEHFDALVVDCQDEQNAALLFKGSEEFAGESQFIVRSSRRRAGRSSEGISHRRKPGFDQADQRGAIEEHAAGCARIAEEKSGEAGGHERRDDHDCAGCFGAHGGQLDSIEPGARGT